MTACSLIIGLAGALLGAAVLYLVFWAFVSLAWQREPGMPGPPPRLRFAVIVPAHDEEEGIGQTLENLKSLDYPASLYDIVVIADNCTDDTAQIAARSGVRCLERRNPELRGKGYALRFAFNHLLAESYDAFVVVDADSVLDPGFLRAMNTRLLAGEKVVQAVYGIANPDATPLTYMMQVGNLLENLLFYAGKTRLGLPAVLRGNGMCFSRAILEKFPWDAFSVVEDTEYTLRLVRAGIHIPFATETRVLARQPERLAQAHTQRVRWASGNLTLARSRALALLREGIARRSGALADLGLSFLVLSKPLLLLAALLLAVVTTAAASASLLHELAAILGMMPIALLSLYLLLGIAAAGVSARRVAYLLCAPWYLGWFFLVGLLGLTGYRGTLWLRTGRT